MTASKDLYAAILSMDADNRGYTPGIAQLGDEVAPFGTSTAGK